MFNSGPLLLTFPVGGERRRGGKGEWATVPYTVHRGGGADEGLQTAGVFVGEGVGRYNFISLQNIYT